MYSLYCCINPATSECAICTKTPVSLAEMIVTQCGHQYCLNCLTEHIEYQKGLEKPTLCPICRKSISEYRLFRLRQQNTRAKEIRFHTDHKSEDPVAQYSFQLFLHDPDKLSSKLQALLTHLHALRDQCPGEKVIVFSQFSSYLDIIQSELTLQGGLDFSVLKFDGRLAMKERERILESFTQNPEPPNTITVLLLSLKAGGVGLNLTAASRVFIMDPWWSPSVEDQAIDRLHRIGQNSSVRVVRFIVENSIETNMLKIQERKKHIGQAVGVAEEERRRQKIKEIQMLFQDEVV